MIPLRANNRRESLLWSIDRDDLPGTSYLFGTMHVRDFRAFGSMALIRDKIITCDLFANEMDLEEATGQQDYSSFLLPDHQSLKDLIGLKKYRKLQSILSRAYDFDLDAAQFLLPVITSNKISEVVFNKEARLSLDEYLRQVAQEQGKIVLGIESFSEQMDILRQIPLAYQVKGLLDLGKNVAKHRKHLLKLLAYYQQGKLRCLYQASKKGLGKMRSVMLYDRNERMAERIHRIIEKDTLFCAIGAAHLGGLKGVIKKLSDSGCRLRPVSLQAP